MKFHANLAGLPGVVRVIIHVIAQRERERKEGLALALFTNHYATISSCTSYAALIIIIIMWKTQYFESDA